MIIPLRHLTDVTAISVTMWLIVIKLAVALLVGTVLLAAAEGT